MCAVNGKRADRRRSSVWNFLKIHVCIEDESKATCDVCKQKYMYSRGGKKIKGYTTSNMKKHLEQCHPDKFKKDGRAGERARGCSNNSWHRSEFQTLDLKFLMKVCIHN